MGEGGDVYRIAATLTAPEWPCEGARIEIEPEMSAHANPDLLGIVLTSLIDNACKFRKPDAVARARIGSREEGTARIFFVSDEGIGFAMSFAPKLFLPFERLHYPGTGIGLANAKRIVERHRGRIWAEGEPGKGATFSFTLG